MRSSVALTLASAMFFVGCGADTPRAPSPTPTSTSSEQRRLVVVGDSLAAGRFADTPEEAFPQQVAASLRAQLELIGIPGFTAAQLAAHAPPGDAQVTIVEAGTNDYLRQTPRHQFAADYRALLTKVLAGSPGARVVCTTIWIPLDGHGLPPARITPASYNATIRRECSGAVADITTLFDANPPTRGPEGRITYLGPGDDFHPNSVGHAAIARAIEAALR